MQQRQGTLVPVLTSQAGSCLTFANWQDASVTTIAYQLDALMIKPGVAFLKKLIQLRDYISWPGTIVLNAVLPPANSNGIYLIRSTYDGQLVQLSIQELASLIAELKPNKVLLPLDSLTFFNEFWQTLVTETDIELYFPQGEPSHLNLDHLNYYGIYKQQSFKDFFNDVQKLDKPMYLLGDFNLAQMQELLENKHTVETNRPALDGMMGLFYSREKDEQLTIIAQEMSMDYQTLDNSCQCKTCSAQLTRAYLHHLLGQTPLLAQRYLVQHNLYFCQNYIINQN
ncbi:queuine tRNA-ribosyltransferase [Legionella beliardensis]|uniref:Queuine tRNA-ribosyltransferase n=1 Tax=Legionella beliardensis TaxID=91822 RepID=A0A378I346_9GAMM|nr:hypothetical protein [Legionella beliardensis]STX29352.1 queuine tRNA-ribosyltransferase [Legionella beliardensis]